MRNRSEPRLSRIILVVAILALLAGGGYAGYKWARGSWVAATVEASAPGNIDSARKLQSEGKIQEARDLLRPIATGSRDPNTAPAALILLAELDRQAGDKAQAMAYAQRAATEFPDSPEHPKAVTLYANLLEQEGKISEALPLYDDLRKNAPPSLRGPALCGLGREQERNKKFIEARATYLEAVHDSPWNTDAWNEALDAVGKMNVQLIFSPIETPESKKYTVGKHDSITSIGNKLNTTQGLLMRANNLETESLQIGQELKWTPKDFRILIERSTCRLFLLDGDGVFKRYKTGLGIPGHETTLGLYKIGNKEKDPTWHKPGEGPIPAGDPRNELGTRWMPWVPVKEGLPHDLGVHGTLAPETVGKYSSHGCARLVKDDIEELYDLVVRSTPVEVVDVIDPSQLGKLAIATS